MLPATADLAGASIAHRAHQRVDRSSNPSRRRPSAPSAPRLRRSTFASGGHQLDRPLEGQRLNVVAAPQAGIRLSVGDIRPETAVSNDDRLTADRVVAELAERG